MAVIFAVGGGAAAAVVGIAVYDNHSDWHEYSDAAERKKRRIEALKQETEAAAQDLSTYKSGSVNPNLTSHALKCAPAMKVSAEDLDEDARKTIDRKVKLEEDSSGRIENDKLQEIDSLLKRIDEIEQEEGQE